MKNTIKNKKSLMLKIMSQSAMGKFNPYDIQYMMEDVAIEIESSTVGRYSPGIKAREKIMGDFLANNFSIDEIKKIKFSEEEIRKAIVPLSSFKENKKAFLQLMNKVYDDTIVASLYTSMEESILDAEDKMNEKVKNAERKKALAKELIEKHKKRIATNKIMEKIKNILSSEEIETLGISAQGKV